MKRFMKLKVLLVGPYLRLSSCGVCAVVVLLFMRHMNEFEKEVVLWQQLGSSLNMETSGCVHCCCSLIVFRSFPRFS